jgi:3-hydroxybutyryl-CoA dehydratase
MNTESKNGRFSLQFTITAEAIAQFAEATGDTNPVHLDDAAAQAAGFERRIAHGMLTAAVFSRVLGTRFPGPGTIYLSQTLQFRAPVYPDTPLVAIVTLVEKGRRSATLSTVVETADGTVVVEGEAKVLLPKA